MTTKTSAAEQLRKLTQTRQKHQAEVRGLTHERNQYDQETHRLRLEWSQRPETHPEEFDENGIQPLPGSKSAKLREELAPRLNLWNGTNEVQPKLDEAIRDLHAAEAAENRFKFAHCEEIVAELAAPAAEAVEQMAEHHRAIIDAELTYRAAAADIEEFIGSLPGMNRSHVALDPRIQEWAEAATDALQHEALVPRASDYGRVRIAEIGPQYLDDNDA